MIFGSTQTQFSSSLINNWDKRNFDEGHKTPRLSIILGRDIFDNNKRNGRGYNEKVTVLDISPLTFI
jgi:hypothetical protein